MKKVIAALIGSTFVLGAASSFAAVNNGHVRDHQVSVQRAQHTHRVAVHKAKHVKKHARHHAKRHDRRF